ncbi:GntR family transcriptional regulator [Bordetella genomosp. 9]|uniref:GntR family transcriptional regulator n=1 Tax=Bordetella genomosp. 9 TaxID=1416803 RepID=A0A1W6Z022_9BORD|nr:GntR family transcriptional regulator [Bordetella genomosp. 9]ARP86697.1 GntR family transcriptional regulator [Bordetella genomosp. 9]
MPSARDLVYAELRRRLMSGAFLPGQRLREEHIASELAVSRTPVRNAIERLAAEGLVKRDGRRGTVVLGWSDRDINDAFELRLLLEPYAARAAAARASAAQIDALEDLNTRMLRAIESDDPDRVDKVQYYNNRFHHALIEAAQSARVRAVVDDLLDLPIIIGSFYFYSREDMLRSVEHHRQIIAALRACDPACAEAAMRLHLAATHLLFRGQRKTAARAAAGTEETS